MSTVVALDDGFPGGRRHEDVHLCPDSLGAAELGSGGTGERGSRGAGERGSGEAGEPGSRCDDATCQPLRRVARGPAEGSRAQLVKNCANARHASVPDTISRTGTEVASSAPPQIYDGCTRRRVTKS